MREVLKEDIASLVLAMWEEDAEEIVVEAVFRFNISHDYAWELVSEAIEEEMQNDPEYYEGTYDYSDDGEALASAGFGTDEDYGYSENY